MARLRVALVTVGSLILFQPVVDVKLSLDHSTPTSQGDDSTTNLLSLWEEDTILPSGDYVDLEQSVGSTSIIHDGKSTTRWGGTVTPADAIDDMAARLLERPRPADVGLPPSRGP